MCSDGFSFANNDLITCLLLHFSNVLAINCRIKRLLRNPRHQKGLGRCRSQSNVCRKGNLNGHFAGNSGQIMFDNEICTGFRLLLVHSFLPFIFGHCTTQYDRNFVSISPHIAIFFFQNSEWHDKIHTEKYRRKRCRQNKGITEY